jgi:hypothetical protein
MSEGIPGLKLSVGWDTSVSRFRLVEVDSALQTALKPLDANDEQPLAKRHRCETAIKGDGNGAVVCLPGATHGLRRVEFSNSLLLVHGDRIVAKQKYIFETAPTRPRTEFVRQLLSNNLVTIDEIERTAGPPNPARLVTLASLYQRVPAHTAAVDACLRSSGALFQGPFVRLMHPSLVETCLDAILRVLDANGATLDRGIPAERIESALGNTLDPACLRAVMWMHGSVQSRDAGRDSRVDSSTDVVGDGTDSEVWWKPVLETVAATVARALLRTSDDWRVADFFVELGSKHPPLAGLDATHLRGQVVVFDGKKIQALPNENLPYDPLLRLKHLFAVKPRWTSAELAGFLGPLEIAGPDLAAFLLKHCREHKHDQEIPTYSLAQ